LSEKKLMPTSSSGSLKTLLLLRLGQTPAVVHDDSLMQSKAAQK
jgi:hypothetical protein